MFSREKARRAIDFIELLHLTDDFHGEPFNLMDWQEKIISDVYGTVNKQGARQFRRVYLEVPKKNAKSQLVSAIANLHLFNLEEPNQHIYGCAATRDQAEIVFSTAVEMIEQDKALMKRVRIQDAKKRIVNKETGSFYRVLSAEAFSKHGYKVSLCIFDELHAQPTRDFWDVMTKGSGLGRKQPMWWVITTAGMDPDRVTIGWEVHEKAEAILKARSTKDVKKDLPTWYPVIYGYQGDDIYNPKNWQKANPALGTIFSLEDMREIADEAKLSKADELTFRWLNLNQWVTTKLASWLPMELFDDTEAKSWTRKDLLGETCYLGTDLSTIVDLSALCLIFPPQKGHDDWRVIWDCFIPEATMQERIKSDKVPYNEWAAGGFIIPTPGNEIDHTRIEEVINGYHNLYDVKERGADRHFATMLMQRLDQDGKEFIDIPQGYALTDSANQVELFLRAKKMTHEKHPVARWCFGNTSVHKNGNAQIKFVKEHRGKGLDRTKRIYLTVAWIISMERAKLWESAGSVYDTRGLLTL